MLPGIIHNPQNNVFTHQVKTNVNNLSFGLSMDGSAPTYLPNLTKAIDLHVHINAGVTVGANSTAVGATLLAALYFRLPTGSRIYITNRGTIWGGGGRGGQGDRGRNNGTASKFVGGGGGGGAGTSSLGGDEATADFDPNNDATPGSGATPGSTTGGAAGTQDPDEDDTSDGGYVAGYAPQNGGDAIIQAGNASSIYIDNSGGLIYAGANGGRGGFQFGPLSGGNTTPPEPGGNTPTSMTLITGIASADPVAVRYTALSTLVWIAGGTYPSVRGVVNKL